MPRKSPLCLHDICNHIYSRVTITFYPSTSAVHVQGMGSAEWLHELAIYCNSSCIKTAASFSQRHYAGYPAPFSYQMSQWSTIDQPHPPLNAASFGINFLLLHNAQGVNPVNLHSCIKGTHTIEIQCNPSRVGDFFCWWLQPWWVQVCHSSSLDK